jgi:hypothetical protein
MRRAKGSKVRQPIAREIKVWIKHMEGAITFLEDLKALPAMHGEVWREKMFVFYTKNVLQLLSHTPTGAQPYLRGFQVRLKRLKSN